VFLGVRHVFASVAQLLGQFVHDVFEYHWVNVLAEQIEEEPVSDDRLLHDQFDVFLLDASVANPQQVAAHAGRDDDHDAVQDHQQGQEPQDQHPEPEENVNFFVENVEWQNAEGVVLFDFARRTELVEGAFCHAREDVDHRIDPVLLIAIGKAHDLNAKGEECSVEESIK